MTGQVVEFTVGRLKGKTGTVIKEFKERHLGTTWEMVQVAANKQIIVVGIETVKAVKNV